MTALVLARPGLRAVVVVSRNAARGEIAAALGLPVVALDEAPTACAALGGAPACVFECAGTPAAARLAVDSSRPLGRVMLVGLALEPLDLAGAADRPQGGRSCGACITYRRAEFAAAIELLAPGAIPADELVTATAPLEDAEATFQALTAPGNTNIKVVLEP